MLTENQKSDDGSPDPSLQTKDGETAGTDSEQKVKSVSLADCAGCSDLTKCSAHITGGTVKQCAPIIDAEAANAALKLVAQLKQRKTHDAITSSQRAHELIGREEDTAPPALYHENQHEKAHP